MSSRWAAGRDRPTRARGRGTREDAFRAELLHDEFDFTRLSNRIAARDAGLATAELCTNLRDNALHRWTPPGGGSPGALNHAVIHALDVTVALDAPPPVPDIAMCRVLDDLTVGGGHAHFGTDIKGRSLRATDIDWSYGSGPALAGEAADLAVHLCGRAVPGGRLQGEALAQLG
jgi:hypothetical protein